MVLPPTPVPAVGDAMPPVVSGEMVLNGFGRPPTGFDEEPVEEVLPLSPAPNRLGNWRGFALSLVSLLWRLYTHGGLVEGRFFLGMI